VRDDRTDSLAVPASSTNLAFGSNKDSGQILFGLVIVPTTTTPGAVSIKDGTGTAITVFVGGAVVDLKPFWVPFGEGIRSNQVANGQVGWQITTGLNVAAIAVGRSI
jgi:hypothetical protein